MSPARRAKASAPVSLGQSISVEPSLTKVKRISGCASAIRLIISAIACASARSVLRNFKRAGVAKKRSATSTRVPCIIATGFTSPLRPASTVRVDPVAASFMREAIVKRATAPIDGSASPRKPNVAIAKRLPSGIFEVAWRSTASARSFSLMPIPSSTTRMRSRPPDVITISMWRAWASIAFSTSSLTAEAGRSTTSPAAMRSISTGSSLRTDINTSGAARIAHSSP